MEKENIRNILSEVSTHLDEIKTKKDLISVAKKLSDKFNINESHLFDFLDSIKNLKDDISFKEEAITEDLGPIIKVAFQGIDGAYSHIAGQNYFSDKKQNAKFIGFPTFQGLFEAVESKECDYAILPIENTTAGSINEAFDLLNDTRLNIIGEEVLEVKHCLIGIEKVPISRIKRIFSHPQAIAQCSIFLSTLDGAKVESFYDTAMAVRKIMEEQDLSQAAIASAQAAKLYGLEILKDDIRNFKENYTRFFIIAREKVVYDPSIICNTALILSTKHVEGALVNCLNILAKHHLNLNKIQSRPRPNVPWEYLFHIEFEGNTSNPIVKKAIEELTGQTSFIKILGSFPSKTKTDADRNDEQITAFEENLSEIKEEKPIVKVTEKKPYTLASRNTKPDDTIIKIRDVIIGGGDFVVMAGPCAVESEQQIEECAAAVAKYGGNILRGGVFKPRTSPYAFQGMGYEGLEIMSNAGRKNNLPIITEVVQPKEVIKIAMTADILQVGARNMQNFPLLTELGGINKPVLLKRGMMSSIDELLSAAEYILAHGNQQVMLCERGIRTFETMTRNTLDLSAVPIIKYYSHLPVIVDPSHAVGDSRWIIPMVEAAYIAGADGVIVEMHPCPAKAMSDGKQSLNFDEFALMMKKVNNLKQFKR